jgi:hypothetical protein
MVSVGVLGWRTPLLVWFSPSCILLYWRNPNPIFRHLGTPFLEDIIHGSTGKCTEVGLGLRRNVASFVLFGCQDADFGLLAYLRLDGV